MSTLQLQDFECIKVLEAALKTSSKHFKLLSHQLISNVPDGFNGLYYTVKIIYQQTGEEKQLSCFLKGVPRNDRHFWYIDGTKLLMKEYEIYQKIIPHFKKFVNFEIPVPECFYVRHVPEDQFQNVMIMNDLKEKGFIMRNPREVMNMNECRLVMRALAKLHSGCVISETRASQSVLQLCEYPQEALWVTDPDNPAFPWVQSSVDTLIELAAKLEQFSHRLDTHENKLIFSKAWQNAVQLMKPSTKFSNVICHGDIWSNNLMFKYIDNEVKDVMIIDLQVYRYVPPITDVLMFIHLNTTRKLRDEHKDELIEEYANNLRSLVEGCGCHLPQGLSLQGLKEQEKEFTLFALVAATGYVPMGQLPPEARIKKSNEKHTEGARDFDVLYDFLNSRSEQVWRGMQMDNNFQTRVTDAFDELLTYIGL